MDTILGVAFLAVIIGGFWMFSKAGDLLRKKASQNVFQRREHGEGQKLVSQRLMCHVDASGDEVRKAILATVKVAPGVPPVIADAYLVEATDAYILYGHGNKLMQSFRGLLRIIESTDGKATVFWEIVDWTEGDGIVGGQSVMKRLIADINTALRSLDSKATLTTLTQTNSVAAR